MIALYTKTDKDLTKEWKRAENHCATTNRGVVDDETMEMEKGNEKGIEERKERKKKKKHMKRKRKEREKLQKQKCSQKKRIEIAVVPCNQSHQAACPRINCVKSGIFFLADIKVCHQMTLNGIIQSSRESGESNNMIDTFQIAQRSNTRYPANPSRQEQIKAG